MFWAFIWIFSVCAFAIGLFGYLSDLNPAIEPPASDQIEVDVPTTTPATYACVVCNHQKPLGGHCPTCSTSSDDLFDAAIKEHHEHQAEHEALKDTVILHSKDLGDVSMAVRDLYDSHQVLEDRIFELESRMQRRGRK